VYILVGEILDGVAKNLKGVSGRWADSAPAIEARSDAVS
jgi:hypothetical protein